ncbi:MAG: acyltransferase [Steroidobacteraceae bacterium]
MPKPIAANDIPELTGLRILAALCVVVSHLHGLEVVSAQYVHDMLDGGRPAVAFFFVLSGFIMNHKYPLLVAGDTAATRRYAFSRFARLYPTLIFSLCMAAPIVIYLMTTQAHEQLLKFYAIKDHHASWLSASGVAQLLGVTGWLPAAALNQPWNGPAWSLSCEFFFYAMFPFLRPLLQRQSSRMIISAMLVAWLLQGIWIMALHAFVPANRSSFLVYQFPLTHLFEFMAGISAGILIGRLDRRQLCMLGGATLLLAALVLAAISISGIFMPASYGLTPVFAVLIVAVVWSSGSPWLAPLRNRVVVALGHSSYALYIVHAPLLVGATLLGIAVPLGWLWLPLSMLASLAIHYWYAEPVRRWLVRRAFPRAHAPSPLVKAVS